MVSDPNTNATPFICLIFWGEKQILGIVCLALLDLGL